MTVPVLFEQYVAQREAELPPELRERNEEDHCTCCLRKTTRLAGGGYCRECLRNQHGYDAAEATVVDAILGGATRAALDASVSPTLIRHAVDQAIDAYSEGLRESMVPLQGGQ